MILLVEDNLDIRVIIEKILTHHGHSLIMFENAETAYQWCLQNQPRLILMDISLPGMDGFTLTQELRKLDSYATIPIIALTAFAMEHDHAKGIDSGCTDYITKPFKPKELAEKVDQYLLKGNNTG